MTTFRDDSNCFYPPDYWHCQQIGLRAYRPLPPLSEASKEKTTFTLTILPEWDDPDYPEKIIPLTSYVKPKHESEVLLDNAPYGIIVHRFETIAYANEMACLYLGKKPEEILNKHLNTILPQDERRASFEFEYNNSFFEVQSKEVQWHNYAATMMSIYNIDARRKQAQQLFEQANVDRLTSVLNRQGVMRFLDDMLEKCAKHKKPMGYVFLDLDKFKFVNDTFGHAAGDWVLIEVAKRLGSIIRPSDKIGRLGGDEFVIVMPMCDNIQAPEVCQRIIDVIAAPMYFEGNKLPIGSSVGYSQFPNDAQTATKLIDRADQAMYACKKLGRGRFMTYANYEKVKEKLDKLSNNK